MNLERACDACGEVFRPVATQLRCRPSCVRSAGAKQTPLLDEVPTWRSAFDTLRRKLAAEASTEARRG
jgi:hypothetical protein